MFKFVVLLILLLCAGANASASTSAKESDVRPVSVSFPKKSDTGTNTLLSYVKKFPQNAYNAFLASLHTIEFNKNFMNLFMNDFLYTVKYSPKIIIDDVKSAQKIINTSFGKIAKSFVVNMHEQHKYHNIVKYINSTELLCYNIANYCNSSSTNLTLNDFNNCSSKILKAFNEYKYSNEIKMIMYTGVNMFNSKISVATVPYIIEFAYLKSYYNDILKNIAHTAVEEVGKTIDKLEESPTYSTLSAQLHYSLMRIARKIKKYMLPNPTEFIQVSSDQSDSSDDMAENFQVIMKFINNSKTLNALNKFNFLVADAIKHTD